MATLNQCSFIGHLGKDPVLEVTSDGRPYTKFSLAVDTGKDETMWLDIVCWEKLAKTMERLLYKGAQVFVQGRLHENKPYKDKKDVMRQSYDIVANNIQLLDKKQPDQQEKTGEK